MQDDLKWYKNRHSWNFSIWWKIYDFMVIREGESMVKWIEGKYLINTVGIDRVSVFAYLSVLRTSFSLFDKFKSSVLSSTKVIDFVCSRL